MIGLAQPGVGDSGVSLDVRVHPMLVPRHHPLAGIEGVNNAIFIKGSAVGEIMLYGPGAGRFPQPAPSWATSSISPARSNCPISRAISNCQSVRRSATSSQSEKRPTPITSGSILKIHRASSAIWATRSANTVSVCTASCKARGRRRGDHRAVDASGERETGAGGSRRNQRAADHATDRCGVACVELMENE